jgi:hypothetical protein
VTPAQQRLAVFAEWVEASSANETSPLGQPIVRGPFLVLVPQSLSLPPGPTFDPRHLPLWIPESQSIPALPPFTQDPPENQDHTAQRLIHVPWMFSDGRFSGALLALTDPDETLQSALSRQLPSLDLNEYPALFLPLWGLTSNDRTWVERLLPLLRP